MSESRCGACGAKFSSGAEWKEHMDNCKLAKVMLGVVDSISEEGITSAGHSLTKEDIEPVL